MKGLRSWTIFALMCLLSVAAAFWLSQGTSSRPFAALIGLVHDIEGLFHRNTQANESTTERQLPAGVEKVAIESKSTLKAPTAHFSDHSASDSAVCGRPPTKDRTDTGTNLVYKWVDEAGQTHLSDTAPHGYVATVVDMAGNKRDFTYEISADGFTLPLSFQGQIYAGSKRIYDTWHFFLGEQKLRQAHIKLRLFDGKGRYDAFRKTAWPNSPPSSGFYSAGTNEAYVNFDRAHPEQAVQVSFHEISHLITASHLGPTPPWLTEGLAEYFETMEVKGQAGTVHLNRAHLRLLQQHRPPSLRQLLSIDRPTWNGPQRDLNYAASWSLIHFLMQGAPGMYALKDVIEEAHAHFCRPFSATAALNRAYPGGLPRLESDWRKWLAEHTAST